jgi:hypothetical protein
LAAAEVALLATIVAHPALTTAPPLVAHQPGAPVKDEPHVDSVGQHQRLDASAQAAQREREHGLSDKTGCYEQYYTDAAA